MKASIFCTTKMGQLYVLLLIIFSIQVTSCSKEEPANLFEEDELIQEMNDYLDLLEERTYIRTREHGYIARAVGTGIIPDGEYTGHRFVIGYSGLYSGIGTQTLVSGTARINIQGNIFQSIEDPLLQSFCCDEGDLTFDGDDYTFTLFGQVEHSTEVGLHNHLFAGLGSTSGYFNLNIENQTGTVVDQASPPHDPNIGLLVELPSRSVRVSAH